MNSAKNGKHRNMIYPYLIELASLRVAPGNSRQRRAHARHARRQDAPRRTVRVAERRRPLPAALVQGAVVGLVVDALVALGAFDGSGVGAGQRDLGRWRHLHRS